LRAKNKLPRRESLKSRAEIDSLLKYGKKISGDCFLAKWEKADEFRYAVLVSGKLGTSVQRNRIKRLTREAIRLNRNLLDENIKLAVLFNNDSKNTSFELINAEISRTFDLINRKA
jgi:ribonuclease P protein component